MSIIGERGYGGTSVDEIAARAGVAKGVVYYYFDSKAALAEQLIKTGLDALAVRLERVVSEDMSATDAITALAHEQMRQVEKRRDFVKFLLSEMWREDREWRETLNTCVGTITAIFKREIRKGIASKEFAAMDESNITFAAQTIWISFLAGALDWTVLHPEDDSSVIADRLSRYVLASLKSPS